MKKLIFIFLVILIACNKEDEQDKPMVITKVEYRVSSSVDGPMIKYINSNGGESIDFLSNEEEWVHTFPYNVPLDSVGFKIKDLITWVEYKIILNTDTVVNYVGPVPEGGYAGWYDIYYQLP